MKEYPTGYCWNCGRIIEPGDLFCKNKGKCERAHDKKKRVQRNHAERTGKRAGYGLAGSTH
jgi:predicted nucleic acid-binding Zn ribbon protein